MKMAATAVVLFLITTMSMHLQGHHEAEARALVEMKKVKEQAFLLGSSLQKGGKPPAPNPATHAATTINQRDFAGHNVNAAHHPPPPRPTAHSTTMQLLFSMPATVTATARK